jgi:16S rRNA C967 or C1407 C5-methylase (RsmB/RsmF family)
MASANLMITNHSGEMFPRLPIKGVEKAPDAAGGGASAGDVPRYMFDRVLADVPCSGEAFDRGLTGV